MITAQRNVRNGSFGDQPLWGGNGVISALSASERRSQPHMAAMGGKRACHSVNVWRTRLWQKGANKQHGYCAPHKRADRDDQPETVRREHSAYARKDACDHTEHGR